MEDDTDVEDDTNMEDDNSQHLTQAEKVRNRFTLAEDTNLVQLRSKLKGRYSSKSLRMCYDRLRYSRLPQNKRKRRGKVQLR